MFVLSKIVEKCKLCQVRFFTAFPLQHRYDILQRHLIPASNLILTKAGPTSVPGPYYIVSIC